MKKHFFSLVCSVVILSSCGPYPDYDQTDSGLYFKKHTENPEARRPQLLDVLTLKAKYYDDQGRELFDSDKKGGVMQMPLSESTYEGDLMEALAMLGEGDSASFLLVADSFFVNTVGIPMPDTLTPGSMLTFELKMVSISNEQELAAERQKQDGEALAIEEEARNVYLRDNEITVPASSSGLYYLETLAGNGEQAIPGMQVSVHYTGRLLDGTIFDSSEGRSPFTFKLGVGQVIPGWDEAIAEMKVGGKATLIIPSTIAYGAQASPSGSIPAYSTLVFDVELMEAIPQDEILGQAKQQEDAKLQAYLEQNNITAKPTNSGLIYIPVEEGTGEKPQSGSQVFVHYTGTLLDGKKFDSSVDRGEPLPFTLGIGQVIPAWDEGIAMTKKGGKAILICPSHLAYGERGAGGVIGPYQTLRFEVELVDIK